MPHALAHVSRSQRARARPSQCAHFSIPRKRSHFSGERPRTADINNKIVERLNRRLKYYNLFIFRRINIEWPRIRWPRNRMNRCRVSALRSAPALHSSRSTEGSRAHVCTLDNLFCGEGQVHTVRASSSRPFRCSPLRRPLPRGQNPSFRGVNESI